MNWNKAGNNYTLRGDGFYISYIPAGTDPGPMDILASVVWDESNSRQQAGETALCVGETYPKLKNAFFILVGDYRRQYEELLPKGIQACLEFYFAQPKSERSWWTRDGIDSIQELEEATNEHSVH